MRHFAIPPLLPVHPLVGCVSQSIIIISLGTCLPEQMALLHNSLSGGPTPISEAKEVVTTGDDAFRFGADDLILYALSGKCATLHSIYFSYPN